jgi:glucokinase
MILAGDISAQETVLSLYQHDKDSKGKTHLGELKTEARFSFSHGDYSNLSTIFAEFFSKPVISQSREEIYAVCLSIAGPIQGKCFTLTNAPWEAEQKKFCKTALAEHLFCPVPIIFLNDMEAIGYSIFTLPSEERDTLKPVSLQSLPLEVGDEEKQRKSALMLVVDGLGQALWTWDEKRSNYIPASSEGGHIDFAARNSEEIRLLQYLLDKSKNSPISYEQVLSIGGLLKILDFVDEYSSQKLDVSFKQELEKQSKEDKIKMLAAKAIDNDPVCKKTWSMFLSILGAQAGNVALTYRSEEGVYLTGFVLVKLIEALRQKQLDVNTFFIPFLKAFSYKEGNFANINAKIPVTIVCKSDLTMAGAAQYALPFITKGLFEVNKKLAK